MDVLDEKTGERIENPDLTVGELITVKRPKEGATDYPLTDSDYETVQVYRVLTEAEKERREAEKEAQELNEAVSALPDAVADLSETVSGNATDVQALSDAIAELSELVSNLSEGK